MAGTVDTDLIELLREVASSVAPGLDTDRVTPERDVTELGMSSIQLMEFVAEIEDSLGIRIADQELTGVRSVSDLLAVVNAHRH